MVLPLAALLGLAVGGGAVTGYAGEVQRKKVKAEEDAEFLRRLQLQTGQSKQLAEFQSDLDIKREKAKTKAEQERLALSLDLPANATLAEIATAQSQKTLRDTYDIKNVEGAAGVGLPMTATAGAIAEKKQEIEKGKKETELKYKKELEGKLKELTQKIDGYNAKTIEVKAEEIGQKSGVE